MKNTLRLHWSTILFLKKVKITLPIKERVKKKNTSLEVVKYCWLLVGGADIKASSMLITFECLRSCFESGCAIQELCETRQKDVLWKLESK